MDEALARLGLLRRVIDGGTLVEEKEVESTVKYEGEKIYTTLSLICLK